MQIAAVDQPHGVVLAILNRQHDSARVGALKISGLSLKSQTSACLCVGMHSRWLLTWRHAA